MGEKKIDIRLVDANPEPPRGAVLQFEVDRRRLGKAIKHYYEYIIRECIDDTLANGGTFVLVANAGKITVVQRPDAEDLEPAQ